jgi:poly-gamma-glutamate synthesis protein (capsule biosynthesis protein)
MDYNEEGVSDTFSALENAGVTYAISGMWGDQYGLYETEKGIKIGFVSVNEYYEGTAVYTYLEDGLAALREQGADLVFALVHWGGDKTHVIEEDQYTMGRWCIDQGYDLVLGCHPHVLQGIECYNGKYIVYSMGNFCYGGNKNPTEKDSMIFQQTFTFVDGVLQEEDSAIRAIPCRLSSTTSKNDYCPVVLTGDEAAEVIGHLNEYSEEFGIAFDNEGYRTEQ